MKQSKLTVIDPKSGKENFLVVQNVNGKALIRAKDAIKYGICGLTPAVYRAWTESGVLNTFAGNGQLRINKYDPPYLCIIELENSVIALPTRKHDRVNEIKMRLAV